MHLEDIVYRMEYRSLRVSETALAIGPQDTQKVVLEPN
jgi:hypothetical protein